MNGGEVLKAIAQLRTDLFDHIDGSDAKLKKELLNHIDGSDAKLRTDLLDQIHGVGAQLHAQIEDLEKRVDDRLVAIEGRLKLQGGLVQSGSRAIARFIEWTEGADSSLFRYDRRLSEVEKRLADLERKSA
jgi:hypothetical protein